MATKPTPPPAKPAAPAAKPGASSAPAAKPGAPAAPKKPKPKPKDAVEGLALVEKGELTFAEAMGLTRTEAYGIAFTAHRYFEHGQVARAKALLEGLMIANPKDAYFPCLLGAIYGREKKEDEALRLYSLSIKLDPKNLTARVNRADLLLRKGDLAKALDDLVAATKLDPTAKTPLGKRAFALARTTSSALKELLAQSKRAPARK